jgi:archaellum biogenesis ATPase FlaH
MDNRKTTTTGIDELDEKLEGGGIPTGSICLFESDLNSPTRSILLQIHQNNKQTCHFVCPTTPENKVKRLLGDLGANTDLVSDIYTGLEYTTPQTILDEINSIDLEAEDIIILDSITELVFDGEDLTPAGFLDEIANIAIDQDVVFIVHAITDTTIDESSSEGEILRLSGYTADLVLTFEHTAKANQITQTMNISRLPIGQGIRQTHAGNRIIEIEDENDRIQFTTGGRI